MYAVHTPMPELTSDVSVAVWPSNRGEQSSYTFTIKNTLEDDLVAEQQVWIFFDASYYDFYVGNAEVLYEGSLDDEGMKQYRLPCLVQEGDDGNYFTGAYCFTKNHQVRVVLGGVLSPGKFVTITLVGVRNPDTGNTLSYTVAIMNYWNPQDSTRNGLNKDYYQNSMLVFGTGTAKFASSPSTKLDLFSVRTGRDSARYLSGTDSYRFSFQI